MGKVEKFTGIYEKAEETKRFFRFEHIDPPVGENDKPNIKLSPFPYPYFRKELIRGMGDPSRVTITIVPIEEEARIEPA